MSLETEYVRAVCVIVFDLSFPVFMRLLGRSQEWGIPQLGRVKATDSSFPCVLTSVRPCSPAGEVSRPPHVQEPSPSTVYSQAGKPWSLWVLKTRQ